MDHVRIAHHRVIIYDILITLHYTVATIVFIYNVMRMKVALVDMYLFI